MRFLPVLLLLLLLTLPAAAEAKEGYCVVGERAGGLCEVWTGQAAWVDDGDTLDVRVAGARSATRVRLAGIQAMEQTGYRSDTRAGECRALDATHRVEELIGLSKGRLRLAAEDAESRSRGRYLRTVAVRIDGHWQDLGAMLIGEGLALWMPNKIETDWNELYSELTQQASLLGAGLFNGAYCGPGPSEGAALKLWASWDADGNDDDFPNGEWIKIKNLDPVNPVPVDGWFVRDSALRRFVFGPGTVIGPNATTTVYVGAGTSTGSEFFWGLRAPIFENPAIGSDDDRNMGDGAYLFDPDGDLRASMLYPCRYSCSDPLEGAVAIDAHPDGKEYVRITNTSAAAYDLESYRLQVKGASFTFVTGTVLQPGDTVRLDLKGDPAEDESLHRHWGMDGLALRNAGGVVRLKTWTDIGLACTAWGDRSC